MSALFLFASLFVFGALVLWFLNVAGLVGTPVPAGGGTPGLMTQDRLDRTWAPIFVAGKQGTVTPGPQARIEKVGDARGEALRLTSATAGADGNVSIEIPAELLDRIAGGTSLVALNLRAVDGKRTQIAIECAFSSLGGCSRSRFEVVGEMTDVVMKLRFSKGTPPHEAGHLLLNTDIAGKGRSVDLFAVGLREGS